MLFGYIFFKTTPLSMMHSFFLFAVLSIGIYAIRSLEMSFFLFLATLPLNTVGAFYFGTSIKLWYLFLFFFLLSILYAIHTKDEQREVVAQKIQTVLDIPLFLFFSIIIISVFQSWYAPPNPPLSWPKFIYYPWIEGIIKILILTGCFLIYYGVQYLLDTKEKIKKYVYIYGIFVIIFAVYGLFAMVWYILSGSLITLFSQQALDYLAGELPRIMGTEKEPVFFGFYIMTILPLFYALFLMQQYGKKKPKFYNDKIVMGGSILLTLALLGTGSRSAILGFICSVFALFFIFKEKRTYTQYSQDILQEISRIKEGILKKMMPFFLSKKGKAVGIICILLLGLFGVLQREMIKEGIEKGIVIPIVGTFDKSYGKYWSTKTRVIAYEYAIDAWKQHPWLGIGYENFNLYSGNKVYYGLILANVRWAEVNNYPLKILTELGIVGFLFFLFFVGTFFFYIIRAIKRTTDIFLQSLLKGYLASFVGIAVILLFSSVIILPYLWVSLGIAVAIIRETEKEYKKQKEEKKENQLL